MKVVLRFCGKIVGLLGAMGVIAAFYALAGDDSASVRLLHFVWVLLVGISLLATGIWLVRRGKDRT